MTSWADNNYKYRKKITINENQVSSQQNNFPIMIATTDADLSKCRADGYDIKFYNSGGTLKLNHEREYFYNTNGEIITWVNVPKISASASFSGNTIYMYYNYANEKSDQQNANATWNDDYVAVWHFRSGNVDASPGLLDSTANAYNLTGATAGTSPTHSSNCWLASGGVSSSAYDFVAANSNRLHNNTLWNDSPVELSEFSMEFWGKIGGAGTHRSLISKFNAGAEYLILRIRNTDYLRFDGAHGTGNTSQYSYSAQTITEDWNFIGFAAKTSVLSGMTWYLNSCNSTGGNPDVATYTVPDYGVHNQNKYHGFNLGRYEWTTPSQYWEGPIGEMRLSKSQRTNGWMWTIYHSISSSSFLTYGSEEYFVANACNKPLRIYYSCNAYPMRYVDCFCTRWDEGNWDVTIETFLESANRDALFANVTPGAVRELYNVLGTPKYIDTTYESGNTLIYEPTHGFGLSSLRQKRTIAVKNISDSFIHRNYFNVKIEGIRLDIE